MRISDWSSDVCSSDLRGGLQHLATTRLDPVREDEHDTDHADEQRDRDAHLDELLTCRHGRSEEHTSALQSLMRIQYAVFCLKKKTIKHITCTQEQDSSLIHYKSPNTQLLITQ